MPISQVLKGGRRIKSFQCLLFLAFILVFFSPWPGIFYVLQVTHVQSQRKLLSFPFLPDQSFGISFINSLYKAPVIEVFEIRGTTIYLKEIVTRSREVIEYYNIPATISQDNGDLKIQDINLRVPRLSLIIGYIGKQRLVWKDQTYPLYDLTGPGGILLIKAKSLSPGHYFWQRAMNSVYRQSSPKSYTQKLCQKGEKI